MEYNLPYDYSRCVGGNQDGNIHPTCSDCMRRLSPGSEFWQSFIDLVPYEGGKCPSKISVKQWEERK